MTLPALNSPNTNSTWAQSQPATTAAEATLVAALCSSLLSANPNTFLTILNNLQLLGYLPLSGLNIPRDVRNLLKSLNLHSFLPNPALWVVNEKEAGSPPSFAESYGYSSPLFLANLGIMFSFGLIIACLNVLFWVLTKLPKCVFSAFLLKLTEKYSWNPLLQYWIQVYLDASVSGYLQLYRLEGSTANLAINAILGVFVAFFAVISPFVGIWVVISLAKGGFDIDKAEIKNWKSLFSSFKNDKGVKSSLFYPLFLLRRLFYASILLTCSISPKLQSISFIAHSLVVTPIQTLAYLLYYTPFKNKVDQMSTVCSEIGISLAFLLTFAYNYDLGVRVQTGVDWGCYVVVYGTLAVGNLAAVVGLVMTVREVWKGYRLRKVQGLGRVESLGEQRGKKHVFRATIFSTSS